MRTMEFTILGSGGNSPTPMPTCECRVCVEARAKGVPYARRGNSLFLHDENILIDTPELVWESLNRERITQVDSIFVSHFHADHTMGLRVLQPLAVEDPPVSDFVGESTTLFMSEETYERAIEATDFLEMLVDTWGDVELLSDGESWTMGDVDVTHISAPIEADGPNTISGFLFEDGDSTAFLSPDENRHFDLDRLPELDLWVKETGYFKTDPDGDPLVTDHAERTALAHEMTFQESLDQVRDVEPDRVVMTEIEELFRRSYDDYNRLEGEYRDLNVEFAHDGMTIEI
jgi:phosphoribosyl 1,2-cyclic phosphate phosphodiesterase